MSEPTDAAHKRERETADAKIADLQSRVKLWTDRSAELVKKCDEHYANAHKRERSDCAKLREALETIWKEVYFYAREEDKQDFAHLHEAMLEDPPEYKDLRNSFFAIAHLVDDALAAPPRNCDRFATKFDAKHEWEKVCKVGLPEQGPFEDWLFAPATEKEGGNDGR